MARNVHSYGNFGGAPIAIPTQTIAGAFEHIRKMAQEPLDNPKVRPVDTLKLIIEQAEFWCANLRKES